MKIAKIISTFYPRIGGMGRIALTEAEGLVARGHEVTIFTMAYPDLSSEDNLRGVKIKRIRPLFRSGDGGWMPDFSRELQGFDVIHLHYPFYGGAHIVLHAKKLWNPRLVLTSHMEATPKGWFKKICKIVYDVMYCSRIFKKADCVLAVDERYYKKFSLYNRNVKSKIMYLNNTVNTEHFFYSPKEVSEGIKHLLFVGNLIPIKGLDVLLKMLRNNKDKYKLTVVGGGYNEAEYHRLVQETGLSKNVEFTGPVNNQKKLLAFYHSADAVVIPSLQESFSLVAAEAMSAGCPVVASDIPGLSSRVSDGQDGFLFTMSEPKELQNALEKLFSLDSAGRACLIERARQKAEKDYSLTEHLNQLEKVYGKE